MLRLGFAALESSWLLGISLSAPDQLRPRPLRIQGYGSVVATNPSGGSMVLNFEGCTIAANFASGTYAVCTSEPAMQMLTSTAWFGAFRAWPQVSIV